MSRDAALEPMNPLLEQAAAWRVRRTAPEWSAADEDAFDAWLAADPAHAEAYDQAADAWAAFEAHAAEPEMMLARRDALNRAHRAARDRWRGPRRLLRDPRAAIAAGVAAVALLAGASYPLWDGVDVYRTGLGERRVVTLSDGSRLSLDGMTRVWVRYSKDARQLRLRRGQARFDVAHDVTRPFRVTAGDKTVVATGTAFNIDMLAPKVTVTLIEGRVVVLPASAPIAGPMPVRADQRPIEMRAGEALTVASNAPPRLAPHVDVAQATAWQQGKLIFDDEPLSQAVARVNRYTDHKVTLGDPGAAAVHVSGVFDTGDVHAFIEAITAYLPVDAQANTDGGVVLRARRTG